MTEDEEIEAMLTLSTRLLQMEHAVHRGSGGVSAENRAYGFRPAFLDTRTGMIYPAAFADGRPAPFHVLDGMPETLVVARDRRGCVSQVVGTVVSGFVLDQCFYTRAEASKHLAACHARGVSA